MLSSDEEPDLQEKLRAKVIDAAANHIVFDGLTEAVLAQSGRDANVDPSMMRVLFPRGVIDLGVAMHTAGDAALAERMAVVDLEHLRYSERVAQAVMWRLEIAGQDRETVRRATSFFALPQNAVAGSKCVWHTADTIWTALGDTSDDLNWYSKRAILSGVYSTSLLYWLGDDSEGYERTRAFVDRRIANVMQFEKTKAQVTKSRLFKAFEKGPGRFLDAIKAPTATTPDDLPGRFGKRN